MSCSGVSRRLAIWCLGSTGGKKKNPRQEKERKEEKEGKGARKGKEKKKENKNENERKEKRKREKNYGTRRNSCGDIAVLDREIIVAVGLVS